jgi:hypothetical protein
MYIFGTENREGQILAKIVAGILATAMLLFTLGTKSAEAQDNGVITFKFINSAKYIVYVRMFSSPRGSVWPGNNKAWVLDNRDEQSFPLRCRVGEKICYGAAYKGGDSAGFWGVGIEGKRGCERCCLTCGTEADDWSYLFELHD